MPRDSGCRLSVHARSHLRAERVHWSEHSESLGTGAGGTTIAQSRRVSHERLAVPVCSRLRAWRSREAAMDERETEILKRVMRERDLYASLLELGEHERVESF